MAKPADFADYKRWVHGAKQAGMRIGPRGLEEAHYIPIQKLRDYWDEERVRLFLTDHSGQKHLDSAATHTIVQYYLRIFATLVFISDPTKSLVGYLDSFVRKQQDDPHLPFESRDQLNGLIHPDPDRPGAMEVFYANQFLFSPISLASPADDGAQTMKLENRHLDGNAVLPMVFKRKLNHSVDSAPGAQLCLFELPPSSGLATKNQLVVAKIFPVAEREYEFHSERSAYFALNWAFRGQPQLNHILEYYGSFVQSGQGVILVEYANHGSLLELFEENNPPYTFEETIDLWKGLASLFNGLAALHNLAGKRPGEVFGVHQDLQPSNIFVFSNESSPKGKFSFKIGDFGLSHLMSSSRANDGTMPDSKGPPPYRAPELMHWNLDQEGLDPGVRTAVDMWSMGCVLLETAVWSVCGERGRKEFRDNRNAETANKSARACHGTFHDGHEVLATVDNVAELLRPRLRAYDNVTLGLCALVRLKLLQVQGAHRLTADQAGHYMLQEIRRAQEETSQGTASVQKDANRLEEPIVLSKPDVLQPSNCSCTVPSTPGNGDDPNTASPHTQRSLGPAQVENLHPSTCSAGHPWTAGPQRARSCATMGSEKHIPESTHRRSARSFSNSREPSFGHSTINDYPEQYLGTSPQPSSEYAASRGNLWIHVPSQPSPRLLSTPGGPIPMHRPSPRPTTIESLVERRRGKKYSPSGLPQDLHGVPELLADRDQVFLIDDSVSMAPFAKSVSDTVAGLASVVKSVDPDGMELRFTSKPRTPYKGKHVTDLLEIIASHKPLKSDCLMETALNVLMDSLVPSQERGLSLRHMVNRATRNSSKAGINVYILTNGVWSGGGSSGAAAQEPPAMFGVDESVKTVVQRLQKAGKNRSYLSLQFIRFGCDAAGKARLRYLDDKMKNIVGWDIIDRRRWDGPVRPMLIGALSEREDAMGSDDSADEAGFDHGATFQRRSIRSDAFHFRA